MGASRDARGQGRPRRSRKAGAHAPRRARVTRTADAAHVGSAQAGDRAAQGVAARPQRQHRRGERARRIFCSRSSAAPRRRSASPRRCRRSPRSRRSRRSHAWKRRSIRTSGRSARTSRSTRSSAAIGWRSDFKQLEATAGNATADAQLLALKQKMGLIAAPAPDTTRQLGTGTPEEEEIPEAEEIPDEKTTT